MELSIVDSLLPPAESVAYDSEYQERREAGAPNALDRANAAVVTIERDCSILTGDRENVPASTRAQVLARFKLAREGAARAARKLAEGDEVGADIAARFCERVAVDVRAFDLARFEKSNRDFPNGLPPVAPFADGRDGAVKHGRRSPTKR